MSYKTIHLKLAVDSQTYSIPDTKRETKDWSSVLHYDAGLCIVCERCTTVCKDMIGDSAIKTTKRGGAKLDKGLKGSMPKMPMQCGINFKNPLSPQVTVPTRPTVATVGSVSPYVL